MTQAVIGINPRIRARRIAVRRAEGRRRLRFLLGALGVVAVCVGTWGLTRTPVLDLDHVRVEGVTTGSAVEITEAAGLAAGAPLVDVDMAAISGRVEELSWVESADVRRDWPGTIRIDVDERVPIAVIRAGEGHRAVLDAAGVVISVIPAAAAPALPLVDVDLAVAPGHAQASARPGLAVVATFPADVVPWIRRVVVSGDNRVGGARDDDGGDLVTSNESVGTVRVYLVGDAVVEFGRAELLDDKVEALRAVLAGADLGCIATIDVSVADLTTIARDPACGSARSTNDATVSDD